MNTNKYYFTQFNICINHIFTCIRGVTLRRGLDWMIDFLHLYIQLVLLISQLKIIWTS
jgi:hypothetical protein